MADQPPIDDLHRMIGAAKSRDDLTRAFPKHLALADYKVRELFAQIEVKLACGAGCSYCCHIPVDARSHEVFLVADYIHARFDAENIRLLMDRLQEHSTRVSSMTAEQHFRANLPCPLLGGSTCSVYAVRPQACRACHSVSVDPCRDFFETPNTARDSKPTLIPLKLLWATHWDHASSCFEDHGFDSTRYDLGSALYLALSNPSHGRRWWKKVRTFPSISAPTQSKMSNKAWVDNRRLAFQQLRLHHSVAAVPPL
jgi:hypothetical protein